MANQGRPSAHCVGKDSSGCNTTLIQSGLRYKRIMLVPVTVKLRVLGFGKGLIQQLTSPWMLCFSVFWLGLPACLVIAVEAVTPSVSSSSISQSSFHSDCDLWSHGHYMDTVQSATSA